MTSRTPISLAERDFLGSHGDIKARPMCGLQVVDTGDSDRRRATACRGCGQSHERGRPTRRPLSLDRRSQSRGANPLLELEGGLAYPRRFEESFALRSGRCRLRAAAGSSANWTSRTVTGMVCFFLVSMEWLRVR